MIAVFGTLLSSPALAAEQANAEASLAAPEKTKARHTIRVEWKGPRGRGDAIQLFDPKGNDGHGQQVREMRLIPRRAVDPIVEFAAPAEPGTYELRYWSGTRKTALVTRLIEVIPGTIEISAPATVEGAGTITIQWQGPGGEYDIVRLHDENADYGNHGERQIVRQRRVRAGDFEGKRVELIAPTVPGKYELQYISGQHHDTVLASRPIEIEATQVTLDAAASVVAGEPLEIRWVGPAATDDEVQITDAQGKRLDGVMVSRGEKTVQITAPKIPGAYALRYWSHANFAVLATRPVQVVEPAAG